MFRFEKLDVWKLSVEYGNKVYDVADKLPKSEIYGLVPQLKRAALSISNNIAEGSGSSSTKDFCRFLDIAIKSTIETVSQLMFAQERKFINGETVEKIYSEAEILVKKIQSLKKYLKKPQPTTYRQRASREASI